MRRSAGTRTTFAALTLGIAAAVAACSDSTGPNNNLQPEDVAGLYMVCALQFTPTGGVLPAVDVMDSFEYPGGLRNPLVGLDPDAARTVELKFVPAGNVTDREIRGSYQLRGETSVTIRFRNDRSEVDPRSLLIPDNFALEFAFEREPAHLFMNESASYTVTRQAYTTLSGVDPVNLPESIAGNLRADLRIGGCST